jgi:hypothetical protein
MVKRIDEHEEYIVSRLLDYYLLGWEPHPIFSPFDWRWLLSSTPPARTDVEQAITSLAQTRLAPFLEKAGLLALLRVAQSPARLLVRTVRVGGICCKAA